MSNTKLLRAVVTASVFAVLALCVSRGSLSRADYPCNENFPKYSKCEVYEATKTKYCHEYSSKNCTYTITPNEFFPTGCQEGGGNPDRNCQLAGEYHRTPNGIVFVLLYDECALKVVCVLEDREINGGHCSGDHFESLLSTYYHSGSCAPFP
jgi:hypothetical protein